MKRKIDKIIIEGARIMFRNFSGKRESKYDKGLRDFCLVIDDEDTVDKLINDGWNIKTLKPRTEDDTPTHYLPVAVSFNNIPPQAFMITSRKMVQLDEESIDELDTAELINVDVIVSPSQWELNGNSGVKAYLHSIHATIEENPFADKYADLER